MTASDVAYHHNPRRFGLLTLHDLKRTTIVIIIDEKKTNGLSILGKRRGNANCK